MNTQNLTYILWIGCALIGLIVVVQWTTKTRFDLKTMVVVSFMSLMSMIIAAYLSIMIPIFGFPSLRFGFSQLPIMITGALFGPFWGMIAGVLEDLLELASGTIVSPYLGFTLNKALLGIIPGVVFLLAKKQPKLLKPLITGLVVVLYTASILFVLNTASVTAAQVTYVLDWPVKGALIGLTLASIPLTYLLYRSLKRAHMDQTQFMAWFLTVILIEILINVILTPIWINQLSGLPIELQILIRTIKASFSIILNTFLAFFIYQSLKRLGSISLPRKGQA